MGNDPRGPKQTRTILVAALTILFVASTAHAVSLYDVVQLSKAGYTDRAIIDLIQKTNSRFYVDADTVLTLKKEGVRDAVIQAILKARTDEKPVEEQGAPPDTSAVTGDRRDPNAQADRTKPERSEKWRDSPVTPNANRESDRDEDRRNAPAATSNRDAFSAFIFEEGPAAEHHHAPGHVHYAVGIEGVPMMVVRSEAGHPNVASRAKEIAEALNSAVAGGDGSFVASSSSAGAGVSFRPSTGGSPILVLPVTRGDVIAWQRRSLGAVSAERLAAYWAALLNDFTRVFLYQQPPTAMADLHLGDSLQSIYREMTSDVKSRDNQSIPRIVDHLTAEEKDHLLELAGRVPAEFDPQRRTP